MQAFANRLKNISIKTKIFLFACLLVLVSTLGATMAARWIYSSTIQSAIGVQEKGLDARLASSGRVLAIFAGAMAVLLVGISYWVGKPMIRRITELTRMSDAISRGNLDLPPSQTDPIHCWDLKQCGETECSAYGNKDIPCWYIDHTQGCGAGLSGCFPEKVQACYTCDVYQDYVGDELVQLERSLRNMTIRLKFSEAGLRESETKYRSLFDSGPNPVFVVDKKTFEIMDANQSAQTAYEYSKDELIGKPFATLGPFELAIAAEADPGEATFQKGYASIQKVRHHKKGKKPFYVNVHSCPVSYGEKEAIIIVTTDITEMMEKDAQLIQACKMTSLGEMSAGIAHELNQPLNAINLGNAFLKKMIDENREIQREDLHQIVHEAIHQVSRAAEIINRLREFGRKTEFVKEQVGINKPIQSVFAIIGRQLSLENIKVQLDLGEELPPILAHNNRLEQVFFNLVSNARDAISQKQKAGPGSDERIIKIRSFREDGRIAVTVSDTGIGIPDDARDKVFEPFFTTKDAGKGMGLGLSIVYGIVKDYDGDIHVEGKEDGGTTFKLTFPVAQDKGDEDGGEWIISS
jgi:PAS domain S-box-containing protein